MKPNGHEKNYYDITHNAKLLGFDVTERNGFYVNEKGFIVDLTASGRSFEDVAINIIKQLAEAV